MTTVRLLADDLTGALDTGAEFAALAAPLHAFWDGAAPGTLPGSAAIDTGTRERDVAAARGIVAGLAPTLAAGGIAYKKIDSLMRGATVAELASCFAAGPWARCVLAPAFPFQGRVTRGGQQYARRADGGWGEAGPPLVAALRHAGVAAQAGVPGAGLAPGISVFDAETDADLAAIVAGAEGAEEPPLWCGTGGLARALAQEDASASAVLPRPILGLFGSDQAATFAQLAACAPYWRRDDEGLPEGELALISVALPAGLARGDAAARIGAALHGVARRVARPGTLIVAGGETLRGLCVALGARSLRLEGRIVPGLPRSVVCGGDWDGVTVVSKSGAFGPPHLLRDLLAGNGFTFEGIES